jgi:poly-gamma-glutamate biosynthesis protein PgsC/CapC
MITLFFSTGIFVGLLFYELTGLVPGGIIVPGYIALYAHQPLRILSTILTSLIALALGRLLLRFIIAYGRRRFGLFLSITCSSALAGSHWESNRSGSLSQGSSPTRWNGKGSG